MIVALKVNQNIQKKSSFVTSAKRKKKKPKLYIKTKRLRSVRVLYLENHLLAVHADGKEGTFQPFPLTSTR
jgi:hypothetical protein